MLRVNLLSVNARSDRKLDVVKARLKNVVEVMLVVLLVLAVIVYGRFFVVYRSLLSTDTRIESVSAIISQRSSEELIYRRFVLALDEIQKVRDSRIDYPSIIDGVYRLTTTSAEIQNLGFREDGLEVTVRAADVFAMDEVLELTKSFVGSSDNFSQIDVISVTRDLDGIYLVNILLTLK